MDAEMVREQRGSVPMDRDGRRGLRRLVQAYLPELIYGANDGIVTTLAVIAGVVGAELSTQVILILGFANLFADGISMAASNYLSERSRPGGGTAPGQAVRHASATFAGFVTAGFVPLLAYLLPVVGSREFVVAAMLAGLTLFVVGAGRALFSERRPLQAGAEMLAIGASAGAVAYGVGMLGAWLIGGAAG